MTERKPTRYPVIIGTAGHIDHGKTTLVKALTGQDADRLPEEKSRGITIDLGFAHMALPSGQRLAFIDVPGHERFVRNMVAGVHGMDAVLLVVAADEGVMPQTTEHLAILRLLGVERGLTVITKAALVDDDMLDVVKAVVEEEVQGTFLEGQPMVVVDAISGQGLEQLKGALDSLTSGIERRGHGGAVRLPIDRAFTVKGFGTVVTGTLVSGTLHMDDSLSLAPSGDAVRVRGLQVHGKSVDEAWSGQRVAVNLAGIDRVDVERGQVLATPGTLAGVDVAAVNLELLSTSVPLAERTRVHVHAGTAEALARIYLFDRDAIEPGSRAFAEVRLESPLPLQRRDRLLIRSYSPVVTIGGGMVLEVGVHHRKKEPGLLARLERLTEGDDADAVADMVKGAAAPSEASALAKRLNMTADAVRELARNAESLLLLEGGLIWDRVQFREWTAQAVKRVEAYIKERPIKPGMPVDVLKTALAAKWPLRDFRAVLAQSGLVLDREWVRIQPSPPELGSTDRDKIERVYQRVQNAGLRPPAFADLKRELGLSDPAFEDIIERLFLENRLLRLEDGLALSVESFEQGRDVVADAIRRDGPKTTADLKEALGVSRRLAVLFLELLDRERVTRRVGDSRELVS